MGKPAAKTAAICTGIPNIKGQRCCIYAHSLNELHEQEKQIQLHLNTGVSYSSGAISVSELAERYISQKLGVRYNTRENYNFVLNLLKKEEFGYLPIREIRPSDAKAFCIKLHNDGKSYSTVSAVRGVLKPLLRWPLTTISFAETHSCSRWQT